MADTKISQLASATTPLTGTELVPVVQGGATKKVPVSALGAQAVATHEAAADPHPQYLTPAEGNAAYATLAQGAKADTAVQPAALASYVQTSDARLSDAREWSAATVTQVDAEAGIATDRRAWSVLRVWQAAAAWWAGSAAKAKLDGIAPNATANATEIGRAHV